MWGAYEYRNNDRSVDPTLGVDEIYQVVSRDGYYYNVSPNFEDGDRSKERVNLLRGVYRSNRRVDNGLRVRFTAFPGVDPRPNDVDIWTLAEKAENGTLENRITIVPSWIVRLFFGGGTLVEVYTDDDLRITYGTQRGDMSDSYLYVMTRVPQ